MPNGPSAINRYGSAIAEGRTPDDAFRDGIGSVPPGPPRPMTAAEANAWLGDLQRRVGREPEAAARIEDAVRADRRKFVDALDWAG